MKKRLKPARLVMLLLAFTLVFAAGCQAIGGLDLNKTLKNALKVTSSESKQTIDFQLQMTEDAMENNPEEGSELIKLLSSIKLELRNVKMQDRSNMSLEGTLLMGSDSSVDVDFALRMNETMMVVELEGAKQPFTLDLTGETMLGMNSTSELDEESLTKLGYEIIDFVGGYAIDNLPNPKDLKVDPVVEPINGISTSMMHVHFQMDGKQLWNWVKSYVDALIADRAGLDAMVKGILETLASNPEIWEAMGELDPFNTGQLDAPTLDEMAKEASDSIAEMLGMMQEEMAWIEEEDQETLDMLYNDSLKLTADMYVDSKLDIRKQQFEISFKPSAELIEESDLPIAGFTLTSSTEQWNVNGPVKADAPDATNNAVALEELEMMHGYQTLKLFDEQSDLYDLLKNKLHITKQTYYAFSDDYFGAPILLPGNITIVPVRDVAESFGAETTYNAKTRMITVFDEQTNTTIQFKSGSDVVIVNGKEEIWPVAVTNVEGTTYVPARKLADTLKANIAWETMYEDMKKLTMEREL